jgi:hypothetical protein
MSQNLATYAISQMPKVTGPDLLDIKIMGKLTAHGLDQPANPFTFAQLRRLQGGWLAILGRHRKLKSLSLKQLLTQRLGQISSVGQQYTPVTVSKLRQHTNVMYVGSGQFKRLNHANRVDFDMQAKTVKGLVAKFLAVGGVAFKKLAKSGSGEPADRDGEAVDHRNDILETLADILEQSLFHYPKVCCLAGKTDSAIEAGEVIGVEVLEEFEDVFVGIEAQDFADDFDAKYLAVGHLWRWASLSQGSFWKEFIHKIISFTKDIYDKIIKVHFFALHGQRNINSFLSSIGQRAFFLSVSS